jgi:transposase
MKQPGYRRRLSILSWHETNGQSIAATCRRFKISRSTFYRWRYGYNPSNPKSLEPKSRRPHSVREPRWTANELFLVASLNMQEPTYGKRRLHRVLAHCGIDVSESQVALMLAMVRERCPICHRSRGKHDPILHAVVVDLRTLGSDLSWWRPPADRRSKQRERRRKRAAQQAAVSTAERLFLEARKRPDRRTAVRDTERIVKQASERADSG